MYDPLTVAFEIRRPWPEMRKLPGAGCYYPSIATVWHCDPETDGSDDSCGWSRAHLTDADRKLAQEIVDWDLRWPYYFAQQPSPGNTVAIVFSLFQMFAWRLERRRLTPHDLLRVFELAATEGDNVQRLFSPDERPDDRLHTICLMLRHYRTMRRPWWRHPRWHLHHWKVQIHFMQALKRYLFSRCSKCGGRFPWGYAPMSGWSGGGPRWFRSEEGVYHHDCDSGMNRSL